MESKERFGTLEIETLFKVILIDENSFSVYTQDRCLKNVKTSYVIFCFIWWISDILILEVKPLEVGKILLIINTSEQYSHYTLYYSAKQAARHHECKSQNHWIPLQDLNTKITTGAICRTTLKEDEGLEKYLQENIPTGKVQRSYCATGALILIVLKKNESLRLYVYYSALNRFIIPNQYPLSLISDLCNKTSGVKWFTRLDLKNWYNLIRMATGDEWKMVFRTKQGLFKYTVMPFGLTKSPALFQEMIGTMFIDIEGYIWCVNNILIYVNNIKLEHKTIVEKVLQQCIKHKLAINRLKRKCHLHETIFLVHVIKA